MTANRKANVGHETAADMSGRKLSRDERKALILADLKACDFARLVELRKRAVDSIRYLEEGHARQVANGMPVTAETLRRNSARHVLLIECIDEHTDPANTDR
jgi:hypothetical protein